MNPIIPISTRTLTETQIQTHTLTHSNLHDLYIHLYLP